jgi:hypothetical protein
MFENYYFSGELGKELLYIREYLLLHKLPLTGMATSHEWLNYGPLYYWIMMPIYKLSNGNPYMLLYVSIVTLIIGIILNYFVVKEIVNKKTAITSTFLMVISPLILWQTSLAKLHTFFFILSPILMYFLYKVWNKDRKYVFWAGLVFGIMFSFHFSQIPSTLVILGVLYIKKYDFKNYLKLFLGILIPNLGIVINDLKIFLWLPYRVAKYSISEPINTISSVNEYLGRNLFWDKNLWILGTAIFAIIFYLFIKNNFKKFKKDFLAYYLISSVGITFIANVLHSGPPIHYFLPIFTTLPILFAVVISKYKYAYLLTLLILLINFKGYLVAHLGDDYVPYDKQAKIAKEVIEKSDGKEFSIKRIGPYDYFPENYSQNYKYLIYYYGGNLIENSDNVITIDENNNFNIK